MKFYILNINKDGETVELKNSDESIKLYYDKDDNIDKIFKESISDYKDQILEVGNEEFMVECLQKCQLIEVIPLDCKRYDIV